MKYWLPLTILGLALGYATWEYGAVLPLPLFCTVLTIAAAALIWMHRSHLKTGWPFIALPAYALFQWIPLPQKVLGILSPARARHVAAAAAMVPGLLPAPLSEEPAGTFRLFLVICGCVLICLLVRELAYRVPGTPWILTVPLVIIAAVQAFLGLAQFYSGTNPVARGTYVNRNHFAGLLEMVLPFTIMYAYAAFHRPHARGTSPLGSALIACGAATLAALLLVGIIHSFSRMGFSAAIFSIGVLGMSLAKRRTQWYLAGLLATLVLFVYLPPDQLIARFGTLDFSDGLTRQDRVELWRESLPLAAAYPVFGCGLGGYESAFMEHKKSAPMNRDDYAHNDYLQAWLELGILGFGILAALMSGVFKETLRALRRHSSAEGRALAAACVASFAAILLHSSVDFNLYIPANAFVLAWVCGIGISVMYSSRPLPAPRVMEISAVRG